MNYNLFIDGQMGTVTVLRFNYIGYINFHYNTDNLYVKVYSNDIKASTSE